MEKQMDSGINNSTPKILLISSENPLQAASRLALDYYNAFKANGYEIDLLTKYKNKSYGEFIGVLKKSKIRDKINSCKWKLWGRPLPGYYFFYKNEKRPPVRINKLLSKIESKYDLVIVLFWQGLLSSKSLEAIHEKLKIPIFLISVDYSPMTGGCHFPINCNGYQLNCGECPAWNSQDKMDFTHKNLLYKQKVYDIINPVIFVNKYMRDTFFINSTLFKNREIILNHPVINENEFQPNINILQLKELNISPKKKFIIFFGSQSLNETRKGIKYLINALNIWYGSLTLNESNSVQLISAGYKDQILKEMLPPFDLIEMGYVDFNTLPSLFSIADVFLSASVFDAGPMMVNQSLSSGTPVVSFEIGTALDVIKDQGTGYCAKLYDVVDFKSGIDYIFRLTNQEKNEMRKKCRDIALKTTSYKKCVKSIIEVYNKKKSDFIQI